MSLVFDEKNFTVKTLVREGKTLTYRAFEHIPYCERPMDAIQTLSLYVPETFYEGKYINGYTLETAPIFFPNTVGGYMPGPEEEPGENFMHETNAAFYALLHGYVVCSSGVRGRGMKDSEGKNIGCAPAHIVDLKAAVRYLKANADRIPGNTERIISNGTSAGGAISALLGASGNHPDYTEYLNAIGAAEADDSVFASSCYCPITNLDHADMAYEWEFNGLFDYHRFSFEAPLEGEKIPRMTKIDDVMTKEQKEMSNELKALFPEYINRLQLKDEQGQLLYMNADGSGSFRDHVGLNIVRSAQKEMNRQKEGREGDRIVKEKYNALRHMESNTAQSPEETNAFQIENGEIKAVDFLKFTEFRMRMKQTPAFDDTSMNTPENELFGSDTMTFRHFTEFSKEHDAQDGACAPEAQIKMMNPMNYIDDAMAQKAEYFRIRHGAVDRDTSLAISEILALKLKNAGIDCNLEHPWGIPHAGDYDLDELFAWIDRIVTK